jgi:hypothetical protein
MAPSAARVPRNFDSPAIEEDNVIAQLRRLNRTIAFAGDDTWLVRLP